tara:strand:- start:437 stop:544 length:108 start_codon:yes stop_codon:yes gene_type:complete
MSIVASASCTLAADEHRLAVGAEHRPHHLLLMLQL